MGPGVEGSAGFDRPGLGWKIQETGFGPVTLSTPCVVRKDGRGVPRAFPIFLAVARRRP
jgi:hypothetical protein